MSHVFWFIFWFVTGVMVGAAALWTLLAYEMRRCWGAPEALLAAKEAQRRSKQYERKAREVLANNQFERYEHFMNLAIEALDRVPGEADLEEAP